MLRLECRALLPDLVRFAYIPANDHRVNEPASPVKNHHRGSSPDIYALNSGVDEGQDHVLIMEFAQNARVSQAK